ncbi:MAG: NADH-quinone oxidoreductase subunit A [Planctomycetota bacterium]|nr:NADH-quinone oxidoreductase subunit A [Planctomycetota bacterium]
MAERYIPLAILFFFAVLVVGGAFIIAWILRPSNSNPVKLTPYECGNFPLGDARARFNPHFYLFAVLFIVFEVEIAFLAPWAASFVELGWSGFLEVTIFLGVVLLGFAYAWRKGDLKWE